MQDHFNGARETRVKPRAMTVDEQLEYAAEFEAWKANGGREGTAGDPSKVHGIKRVSILFRLPYWKVSTLPWCCVQSHVTVLCLLNQWALIAR